MKNLFASIKKMINQLLALDVNEEITEPVSVQLKKVTTKPKLPTTKVLEGLTKAKLEDTGRDFGVELDKRMTKSNMIKDLRAQYKKL